MKIIHKALGISLLIHLVAIVSLMVFSLLSAKEHYTPVYQVSLLVQKEPEPKRPAVEVDKKKPLPRKPSKPKKKTASQAKRPKKPRVTEKQPPRKAPRVSVQRAIDAIKKKMASRERIQEEKPKASRIIEAKRNAYFDTIASHIQANWSLLKNQMEDVGILTTDIGLQILRDGRISKIVIEKPSGNALFDEYAVRAVKRSTPLPPFPKELKESRLEVTIGLSS
ncbi:MAG: TonB family protein [Deltaproteobacteria bacterium]|nr:TonB family protein [Deltaproteobacteria bacterium]